MSKKLALVLVIIAGLMFGLASLTNKPSKNQESMANSPDSLSSMVGIPAPDFSLPDQNGKIFKLSDMKGKKVVLFFNEGIMCYPACWNQMASLGADSKLNSEQIVSASIVNDQADQWIQALKKMPELGKGMILLDTDKKVSQRYGMLSLPSSMHRGNMPGHTYLVIDGNGIVRYTLDDPQMGIRNDQIIKEVDKI
ncbi:MAG: redoxin family protein [Patescibacteria group bacterium]